MALFGEDFRDDEVTGGIVHIQGPGAMDAPQAFLQLPMGHEQFAHGVPAPVMIGIALKGGGELRFRTSRILHPIQGDGKEPKAAGVPGLQAERLEQPALGFRSLILVEGQEPEQFEGLGVGAIEVDGVAEGDGGAIQILHLQTQKAQVALQRGDLGGFHNEAFQLDEQFSPFFGAEPVAETEHPLEPGVGIVSLLGDEEIQ